MHWACIIALLFICATVDAQDRLSLVSGEITLKPVQEFREEAYPGSGWHYAVVGFGDLLSSTQRDVLKQDGLIILHSIDDKYLVKYPVGRRLAAISPSLEIAGSLEADLKFTLTLTGDTQEDVMIGFDPDIGQEGAVRNLEKAGAVITDTKYAQRGLLSARLDSTALESVSNIPWIFWIEKNTGPEEEIRYRSLGSVRAGSAFRSGLSGTGVVIGVGDGGKVGNHIDLNSQLEQYASFGISSHATHVSGIVGGRGHLDPSRGGGVAPGADLLSSYFSNIIAETDRFVADEGMTLTNNSYGSAQGDCDLFGDYNLSSVVADAQIYSHDTVLHVFAAGNSGSNNCSPYSSGAATILTGFQSAKNVLSVGSVNKQDGLSSFSSRGPVDDGRLKPEIVAVGAGVNSTRPNNIYASGNGTSYSAPSVTGACALITEQYKQIEGISPPAALVKALLCNTSDDLGRPGPDYQFGFGRMNLREAVIAIENQSYKIDTLENDGQSTFAIEVPSGLAELRVMLAWSDPESVPFVSPSLVNDLDLTVISGGGQEYLPWVLDPTPSGVTSPATRGRDSLNNYEQITIDFPEAGTYELVVDATSVPMGPQKFVVTYSYITDSLQMTLPMGHMPLLPGRNERVRWDANGNSVGTFSLDVSYDSITWTSVATNLNSARRYADWTVPDSVIDNVYFRVSSPSATAFSDGQAFIVPVPSGFNASSDCPSFASLSWSHVPGADHYNVYTLTHDGMQLTDTTSSNTHVVGNLNADEYWFAVAAVSASGNIGYRTVAKRVVPVIDGSCSWSAEVYPKEIITPADGRKHTSSQPGIEQVTVSLVNTGSDSISGFPIAYVVNGLDTVFEIFNDTLLPGTTSEYVFSQTLDLSAVGDYALEVYTALTSDAFASNDTVHKMIRHLDNQSDVLPVVVDFESLPDEIYEVSVMGLEALDRVDFIEVEGAARLRTAAGTPLVLSGTRSLTFDAMSYNAFAASEVILNFNLSSLDVDNDDLRMSFKVMSHNLLDEDNSGDMIYVRGDDTSSWIPLFSLEELNGKRGELTEVEDIFISEALRNNGQQLSASTQVRIGFEGAASADSRGSQEGFTVDDVEMVLVGPDLKLSEILSPVDSCGLGVEDVSVMIRNPGAMPVPKINAYYVFDGDTVVNLISSIAGNTDTVFTFDVPVDLSMEGTAVLDVWITSESDANSLNDSLLHHSIRNLEAITPGDNEYFESFENDAGGWYATGVNASLELGVPAGTLIADAAHGNNAWVTGLTGNHKAEELSYLISPCFDLSGYASPVLSFAHAYQIEANYDFGWVEYSLGGGEWTKLGTVDSGFNWYNDSPRQAWDGTSEVWHVASIPVLAEPQIQFRFVFDSDVGLELEGMAIDAIHIHESAQIHDSSKALVVDTVESGTWNHALTSTDGLVASILSESVDLGETSLEYYPIDGAIQNDGQANYLNQVVVIESAIEPTDTVHLRLYVTHDAVLQASMADQCETCVQIEDPFEIEVATYDGPNEDSILINNESDGMRFIGPDKVMPFDSGYIVEFSTTSFSEFWLTSTRVPTRDSFVTQVNGSTDDAHEWITAGAVDPYSGELKTSTNFSTGLRFTDLIIPSGAFVKDARLILTFHGGLDSGFLRIHEISQSDPSPYSTGNYNITDRPVGEYDFVWSLSGIEADSTYTSPSLRSFVQSRIEDSDWRPGNSMAMVLTCQDSLEWFSYEGNAEYSAQLMVSYDTICSRQGRLFVSESATGENTGEAWSDAFRDLQQALDLASRCSDISEIWISEGVYYPSQGTRARSFEVPPGISIYGGFAGTESLLSERDVQSHPVVLSGDIGIMGDLSDNSYNVLTKTANASSLIDGVTIRDGMADGAAPDTRAGAGVLTHGSIELNECIIENCTALDSGSAIYHSGQGVEFILSNCTLRNNSSQSVRNDNGGIMTIRNANTLQNDN